MLWCTIFISALPHNIFTWHLLIVLSPFLCVFLQIFSASCLPSAKSSQVSFWIDLSVGLSVTCPKRIRGPSRVLHAFVKRFSVCQFAASVKGLRYMCLLQLWRTKPPVLILISVTLDLKWLYHLGKLDKTIEKDEFRNYTFRWVYIQVFNRHISFFRSRHCLMQSRGLYLRQ